MAMSQCESNKQYTSCVPVTFTLELRETTNSISQQIHRYRVYVVPDKLLAVLLIVAPGMLWNQVFLPLCCIGISACKYTADVAVRVSHKMKKRQL